MIFHLKQTLYIDPVEGRYGEVCLSVVMKIQRWKHFQFQAFGLSMLNLYRLSCLHIPAPREDKGLPSLIPLKYSGVLGLSRVLSPRGLLEQLSGSGDT